MPRLNVDHFSTEKTYDLVKTRRLSTSERVYMCVRVGAWILDNRDIHGCSIIQREKKRTDRVHVGAAATARIYEFLTVSRKFAFSVSARRRQFRRSE